MACIFPVELIYRILCHADPLDLIRWRTVSKWFRTITHDRMLWKAVYTNVPFPRPSGPFPSQSNAYLERTLVRSAHLAQTWTTRPLRDVSSVEIRKKADTGFVRCTQLIRGRWHIACELGRRLLLYDVDACAEPHAPQVLWEHENRTVSFNRDACLMKSVREHQCVLYLLTMLHYGFSDQPQWQLLEFRLNNESGKVYDSAVSELPACTRWLRSPNLFHNGNSPFLFIQAQPRPVVFDIRIRVFYELPEFHVVLDNLKTLGGLLHGAGPTDIRMVFTDTHIFAFFTALSPPGPPSQVHFPTIIHVFTPPPDGHSVQNGNPVLLLTHEGVADLRYLQKVEISKSCVDPNTGAVNVKLLDCHVPYLSREPQITRIDLTLPKPYDVDVLPLTVETENIDFPKNALRGSGGSYTSCVLHVDVSDNGHVRGLCLWSTDRYSSRIRAMKSECIMKFTIDTTRDQWVVICGKLSRPNWKYIEYIRNIDSITLDGMSGRLSFVDKMEPHTSSSSLVVLNIE